MDLLNLSVDSSDKMLVVILLDVVLVVPCASILVICYSSKVVSQCAGISFSDLY